jgi:hypothetical protein
MAREPWPVTATGPGAMVSADIRGMAVDRPGVRPCVTWSRAMLGARLVVGPRKSLLGHRTLMSLVKR